MALGMRRMEARRLKPRQPAQAPPPLSPAVGPEPEPAAVGQQEGGSPEELRALRARVSALEATLTPPPSPSPQPPPPQPGIGHVVEALSPNGIWRGCAIVEVERGESQAVLLHYHGFRQVRTRSLICLICVCPLRASGVPPVCVSRALETALSVLSAALVCRLPSLKRILMSPCRCCHAGVRRVGACCRMAAAPPLGRHPLRRRHTARSNHAMEPRRRRCGGAIARRRRDRKHKTGSCSRF